jgi:hypothetical protein
MADVCGLEVEHELIFRRLLEWQLTRLFTAQITIHVPGSTAKYLAAIGAVECQAAQFDIDQVAIDRRQAVPLHECNGLLGHRLDGDVGQKIDRCVGPLLVDRSAPIGRRFCGQTDRGTVAQRL